MVQSVKIVSLVVAVQTGFATYGSLVLQQWGYALPIAMIVTIPVGFALGSVLSVFVFPDKAAELAAKKVNAEGSEASADEWQEFEDGVPTDQEKQLVLEIEKELATGSSEARYASAVRVALYRDWLLDEDYDEGVGATS